MKWKQHLFKKNNNFKKKMVPMFVKGTAGPYA